MRVMINEEVIKLYMLLTRYEEVMRETRPRIELLVAWMCYGESICLIFVVCKSANLQMNIQFRFLLPKAL